MTGSARRLVSGAAGALALTGIHQAARRRLAHPPRMDVIGTRALRRVLPENLVQRLDPQDLYRLALIGDLISNSLYYSAIAARTRRATWTRAAVLGVGAGLGALMVPERIGLGTPPDSDRRTNQVMTVAWYTAGALAAAACAIQLRETMRRRTACAPGAVSPPVEVWTAVP